MRDPRHCRRSSHDATARITDLRALERLEQQLLEADERIVRLRRTLAGRSGPPPALSTPVPGSHRPV